MKTQSNLPTLPEIKRYIKWHNTIYRSDWKIEKVAQDYNISFDITINGDTYPVSHHGNTRQTKCLALSMMFVDNYEK